MVCYSSHVWNSKLIQMVKSLVTEQHLVTELFTIVANKMVMTIQLAII